MWLHQILFTSLPVTLIKEENISSITGRKENLVLGENPKSWPISIATLMLSTESLLPWAWCCGWVFLILSTSMFTLRQQGASSSFLHLFSLCETRHYLLTSFYILSSSSLHSHTFWLSMSIYSEVNSSHMKELMHLCTHISCFHKLYIHTIPKVAQHNLVLQIFKMLCVLYLLEVY